MKNNFNCIIVHGCPSDKMKAMNFEDRTYDKHWIPWTREALLARGIKTETPLMPEPWAPDYEAFKKKFETLDVSEDTVLIGHSCGCAFLVRWLGDSKKKIKKLILVAPWKVLKNENPARKLFYDFQIDETIKSRVGEIVMFTSDNEREGGKDSLVVYHKYLGGKIIELKGKGHYISEDMGTTKFPELLEEILK